MSRQLQKPRVFGTKDASMGDISAAPCYIPYYDRLGHGPCPPTCVGRLGPAVFSQGNIHARRRSIRGGLAAKEPNGGCGWGLTVNSFCRAFHSQSRVYHQR